MTVDRHYSPAWLADNVARSLPSRLQGAVFDPAAGDGALLDAVERRFGDRVSLSATDLDLAAIRRLSNTHPSWRTGRIDVLSAPSRLRSPVWAARMRLETAAVVLNPPFSYRGGAGFQLAFGRASGRLSPASAFVATVMAEVHPHVLIVVMPEGSLSSVRDEWFWSALGQTHRIEDLMPIPRGVFTGATARANLLRISSLKRRHPDAGTSSVSRPRRPSVGCVEVIRGRVPVHNVPPSITPSDPRFVHSTDLVGAAVRTTSWRAPARLATAGPLVLLPRVGLPTADKIAVGGTGGLVLSDCLFGLRCIHPSDPQRLRDQLAGDVARLQATYHGSCARHLTTRRLMDYLSALGWTVRRVDADALPGGCECGTA